MHIRHWFLPNKHNKYHPHALRPLGLGLFLLAFIAIPFSYNMTAAGQFQVLGYATNISSSDLLTYTNNERASSGLDAYSLDTQLSQAALAKASHMISNNYWAHVAPDGTTPWSFIYASGYDYSAAGENLAKNFNTSAGVVAGWMGSATHKANILSGEYSDVGFAVVNGTLLGTQTTLVVAMYGERVEVVAPAPTKKVTVPQQTVTPKQSEPTPAPVPKPVATEKKVTTTEKESTNEDEQTVAPVTENPTTTIQTPADTPATTNQGEVEGLSTFLPIQAYVAMNWGQKASLVLMSVLMLLFVMKHTIVWRQQRKGLRHIWLRAHPLSQGAMLVAVFVVTILTSTGVIL